MPRFCASCGAQVADTASTCSACGKAVAQPVGGGAAAAPAPAASGGMADNVAGALACVPLIGLIFLLIEPYNKNKFVRFFSFQAVAQGVCWFIGNICLMFIPILGWIALPFWMLANVIVMIVCAVKAYGNNRFKLPVLGDFAEKHADA